MIFESFACENLLHRQNFSLRELRQHIALFLFVLFVFGFKIDFQEPIKFYDFTACDKVECIIGRYTNCRFGFLHFGRRHLRSNRPFPYQLVQLFLRSVASGEIVFHMRRSDTFVSFLRSFALGHILRRLGIVFTISFYYLILSHFDSRF